MCLAVAAAGWGVGRLTGDWRWGLPLYAQWDATKAALEVKDYRMAISWTAQTALRDIIGTEDNNMKVKLFLLVLLGIVAFVFRGVASAPGPMFIPAHLLIGLGLLSLGTGAIAYLK